jgi:succinate dehydrogenase / fumarate reductase iron-sulfur subunit
VTYQAKLRVWRATRRRPVDYEVGVNEGEVGLDIIHRRSRDLTSRCGGTARPSAALSAEINGARG